MPILRFLTRPLLVAAALGGLAALGTAVLAIVARRRRRG
jgi:hypothetical protein